MFTLMCTLGLCTLRLCTLRLWGDDVPVSISANVATMFIVYGFSRLIAFHCLLSIAINYGRNIAGLLLL